MYTRANSNQANFMVRANTLMKANAGLKKRNICTRENSAMESQHVSNRNIIVYPNEFRVSIAMAAAGSLPEGQERPQ